MAPSAPISRVMSHSKALLGVAVRKVTPFFTVALWEVKNEKGQECVNVECPVITTNGIRGNECLFIIFIFIIL